MIAVIIVVVLIGVAVVGWLQLRRHGESPVPASNWQATTEVFRDPSSDRVMRVWVDPGDGSRHYVPDERRAGRGDGRGSGGGGDGRLTD